jgi:hypothetical protein
VQISLQRNQIAAAFLQMHSQDPHSGFAAERQELLRGKDSFQLLPLESFREIEQGIGPSRSNQAASQSVLDWLRGAQLDTAKPFTLAWAHHK